MQINISIEYIIFGTLLVLPRLLNWAVEVIILIAPPSWPDRTHNRNCACLPVRCFCSAHQYRWWNNRSLDLFLATCNSWETLVIFSLHNWQFSVFIQWPSTALVFWCNFSFAFISSLVWVPACFQLRFSLPKCFALNNLSPLKASTLECINANLRWIVLFFIVFFVNKSLVHNDGNPVASDVNMQSFIRCVCEYEERRLGSFTSSAFIWCHVDTAAALSNKIGWVLRSSEFRPLLLFPWQQNYFALLVWG